MSNKTNENIREHQFENKEILALKETLSSENTDKTQDMIIASHKLLMREISNWGEAVIKNLQNIQKSQEKIIKKLK